MAMLIAVPARPVAEMVAVLANMASARSALAADDDRREPNTTTSAARSTSTSAVGVSTKIGRSHLDRAAVIYVRQSTLAQVREHTESTARQYALAEQAVALGWDRRESR